MAGYLLLKAVEVKVVYVLVTGGKLFNSLQKYNNL